MAVVVKTENFLRFQQPFLDADMAFFLVPIYSNVVKRVQLMWQELRNR